MKRYITLISFIIITIGLIGTLFYFLLKHDNSNILYIKLQVNPSFVLGINDKTKVVFYNALNEDGNKYNLSMFQGKDLKEAMNIFVEKLGNAKENKSEINVTIMTKNNKLEREIKSIIEKEVKNFDSNYHIVTHEPTKEELERYSNENVYNLKPSLSNNDLKKVSTKVYEQINDYVINKINILQLDKISDDKKIALLKDKQESGYFSDYNLLNIKLDNIVLLERTSYDINFVYEEDLSYSYYLTINLEMEKELKNNDEKVIIEVYKFDYQSEKDLIDNLSINYYTF